MLDGVTHRRAACPPRGQEGATTFGQRWRRSGQRAARDPFSGRRGPGPWRGSPHPRRRSRRRAVRRRPTPRAPTTSTSVSAAARISSSRGRPIRTSVFTRHPARARRSRAASSWRWARPTCSRSRLVASLATMDRMRAGRSPVDGGRTGSTTLRRRTLPPRGSVRPATNATAARACGEPSIPMRNRRGARAAPRTTSTEDGARRTHVRLTLPRRRRPTAPSPREPRTSTRARTFRARARIPGTGGASVTKTSASGQRRWSRRSARRASARLTSRSASQTAGAASVSTGVCARDDAVPRAARGPRECDRALDRGARLGTAVGCHQHRKAALCHESPRAGSHRPAECNRRGPRAGSVRSGARLFPLTRRGVPSLRIPPANPADPEEGE